jgi:hypothetical protein
LYAVRRLAQGMRCVTTKPGHSALANVIHQLRHEAVTWVWPVLMVSPCS